MTRTLILLALASAALLPAGLGRASLYQPDDPMAVPVRPDGTADPLPFGAFKTRMAELANTANPTLKGLKGANPDRDKVLERVKAREEARDLSPDETAALAADLLRLGNTDEAANRLKPLYDDRQRKGTRTYAVCAALIHTHAARGEWGLALNYLPDLFDAPPAPTVKGLTPAQWDWQRKLDRDYLPHYLMARKAEADARPRPAPGAEEPTPLFPLPGKGKPADPVRFVNDAGKYEPGTLAAGERAKLPPDAVAITQQFLLWFPSDTRLYWLLGELYAAAGRVDTAQAVMDLCVSEARQYGNRKLLVEHRAAVRAAVAAKPPTKPAEELLAVGPATPGPTPPPADNQDVPINMSMVWVYFGAVAAIAVLAALRVVLKRGGCGPVG